MKKVCLVLSLFFSPTLVTAADIPLSFTEPELQNRYLHLLEELRCLVCQNQSLADSHAELAQDLRNEVYRILAEGRSDDAVIQFMVERYGDFVLYRPPLKPSTWPLWIAPFFFMMGAVVVIYFRRRRPQQSAPLDSSEREKLEKLLKERK
jgi:cytochrome c-type biogenesis protein CcmH